MYYIGEKAMKKDRKFLIALELNLSKLSKKNRDKIVSKYYDIIEEEKSKKRKITNILKDLGKPEEVAKREIENLKKNNRLIDKINNVINTLKNHFKNKTKKVKKESLISKIKNKIKRKDTLKNNIEDIIEESKEEIINVSEIVTDKNIFENRSTRIKRIVYKTLGVILTIILLFIWLWLVIIFMASMFALLDGIKIYGINIALLGIVLLVLTIVILINKSIFRKKISLKWSLILIILFIVIIAFGITLSLKEISKIKTTHDVSDKYTMTRSFTTYKIPSNNKPLYITFNSNYKTKYIVEYDESMKGKIGVEVKYYECYYDYFIKKGSDNIYISLKLNKRDRLSVYIEDLKEGKIYDNDELERYTIKITGSKSDIEKVIID